MAREKKRQEKSLAVRGTSMKSRAMQRSSDVFVPPFSPDLWRGFISEDAIWAPAIHVLEKENKFVVKVELCEKASKDPSLDKNALKNDIQKRIHIVTGISADVEIVKPGELPRTEGKAKRVLDLRKGKM